MRICTVFAPLALAAAISAGAHAATVVDALPYPGTSDWTYGAMNPGNTFYDGTQTVMTTSPYAGNFFGWGTFYSNTPTWTPGTSSEGNYLSLTASVSSDAADWHAYFYDNGGGYAQFTINPTFCDSYAESCYDNPAQQGVAFSFGGPDNAYSQVFVALDTSQAHTYEFLLKDGVASYRVDGAGYFGQAYSAYAGAPLLVIGDSSGTNPTGVGAMTISAVSFDNAPAFALENVQPVPEPGEWAMILAGLGIVGAAARRRRAV